MAWLFCGLLDLGYLSFGLLTYRMLLLATGREAKGTHFTETHDGSETSHVATISRQVPTEGQNGYQVRSNPVASSGGPEKACRLIFDAPWATPRCGASSPFLEPVSKS
eukprot:scaffold3604_cov275-Pinguiococcus_pyrenoidosus.AAC.5